MRNIAVLLCVLVAGSCAAVTVRLCSSFTQTTSKWCNSICQPTTYYCPSTMCSCTEAPGYSLATFGDNSNGQIGDGTYTDALLPKAIPGTVYGKMAVAGYLHSAVFINQTFAEWGHTYIGDGSADLGPYPSPTAMPDLAGVIVKGMCSGDHFTLVVSSTGEVYLWGFKQWDEFGLLPSKLGAMAFGGQKIDKVECGQFSGAFFSASSGRVWSAGSGYFGQLGTGLTSRSTIPVESLLSQQLFVGEIVKDVSAGSHHTIVLTTLGRVFVWGKNENGQVGDGTLTQRPAPTLINFGSTSQGSVKIALIGSGYDHSLAKATTGELYAWGDNAYSQLCVNAATQQDVLAPLRVDTASGVLSGVAVVKLEGSAATSLFLSQSGRLYGCGSNALLGVGVGSGVQAKAVVVNKGVLAGRVVRDVSAFYMHTVVVYE
eukprot:c11653_g1_i1.p1 GENE.c11653_g1_i1~~c11653_g1_i1.p1  ORF type:complete len:440 (-),score=134.50 c11653_g1_i1:93-1379(-)